MSNDFRIGARGNVYQLRNFNLEVVSAVASGVSSHPF
jgi:hypothetical protein